MLDIQNASNNVAQLGPNRANLSQSVPIQPIGVDVGNGAVKLYSANGQNLIQSYVLYLGERATHCNQGYVEYVSGARNDLAGKQWIGGLNAYYQSPTHIYRVTDDKDGKVDLCLQLLLSAVSHWSYRPQFNLLVTVSVHDGKIFGKAMRAALEGHHRIRVQGKDCIVNISVASVVEEGVGVAVALQQKHDFSNALLLDIGNGTTIISAFNGLQMSHRDYEPNAGVERLYGAIAASDYVRGALKKPGDRHLIRTGVEDGSFTYGTQLKGWNFREAYKQCLPSWFEQGLKPFVRASEERFSSATAIIAVGGGSMLPGIAEMLAQKGITVPDGARWLNAQGLFQLALRRAK
ncbi:MAG: hypothetical protein HC857_01115 [Synechococcales cyanobacterium RU_4_20]|nr:hypothetical protein [Synechococcales cyanobacterium RU_4_20]NJR71327.1 hypothetical protein [Synechococcales cyanobacterium CRU_2_2]